MSGDGEGESVFRKASRLARRFVPKPPRPDTDVQVSPPAERPEPDPPEPAPPRPVERTEPVSAPERTKARASSVPTSNPATRPSNSRLVNFLDAARRYWANNVRPEGERVILVDLMAQDLAVIVRTLTMANGIRRVEPARLVGILGTDPDWERAVWDDYDAETVTRIAEAYGVREFVRLGEWAEARRLGEPYPVRIAGRDLDVVPHSLDAAYVDFEALSSALRIQRFPRDCAELRALPETSRIIERTRHFADVWHTILTQLDPLALIVAHVDYNAWGTAVNEAMRSDVPVIHVQSTGSLKAYAWFPENRTSGSFRAQMTEQIAQLFDDRLWPNRQTLRRSAELIASRVKLDNGGRPSWWKSGGSLTLSGPEERRMVRRLAARRLGIDPDRPVIGVFAHAQSDALGSNVEVFDDFAEWLGDTASFAAGHDEVTWLFLDHPSQFRYDVTDFFGQLARRYADHPHLVFRPSVSLRKNSLWSLVDFAVTVRGSVSNEFPTFGVPTLQAGWSEWSHLGFSRLATSREDYFAHLNRGIAELLDGEATLDPEAVERARLWQWLYRAGAEVVTQLVPPWQWGSTNALLEASQVAMNNIESVADPAMVAIRRLWTRKEPVLARIDFDAPLADQLADVDDGRDHPIPDYPLRTLFDPPRIVLDGQAELASGESGALTHIEGIVLGQAVIGRVNASRAMLAIGYRCGEEQSLRIGIAVQLDRASDAWWAKHSPDPEQDPIPPATRHIVVFCQNEPVAYTAIARRDDECVLAELEFTVPADRVRESSTLMIELLGMVPVDEPTEGSVLTLLSGLQIDRIVITPTNEPTAECDGPAFESAGRRIEVRSSGSPPLSLDPPADL